MVLVFIMLAILITVLILSILIILSTLNIEIKDFEVASKQIREEQNSDYAVIISLYLGNKIKWISVHLNSKRMRKMYSKMQLEKIDIKKLEKDFSLQDLKIIKKLKPKISYLNLKAKIGLESPVPTAFLVSTISSIIAIILPHFAIKTNLKSNIHKKTKAKVNTYPNNKQYYYEIIPIYQNKNLYKIQFNCIIQVKMVHIIDVIYIFLRKERSIKNERTTSNRRAYGYSYE